MKEWKVKLCIEIFCRFSQISSDEDASHYRS